MPKHGSPDEVAEGVEYVFAHLIRNLSKWLGVAGCNVLFARAFILSTPHHPVLAGVSLAQSPPYLNHLADGAREYGNQAVASATTDVLASVITMLSGLIGSDIAASLLEEVPLLAPDEAPVAAQSELPATHPNEGSRMTEIETHD